MTRLIQGLTIAAVAALLATGCGVKKQVHQKCLDELTTTQSRLSEVERERDAKARQLAELEQELEETAAERDQMTEAERAKQKRIAELMKDMQATEQELLALRAQQEKAQQRLAAFQRLNERFRALVDTGKLTVGFRNGQMVLELPSEVLFPSGRARLRDAGEGALTEVFDILKEFKDRRFIIAGHTDNVAINGRRFKNNWYLSTARAVSVVEFMVEAGFDPKNVAAAGYGEFDPVASNDTDEGRQRNRRIEIILVPDLSELPNLTVGGES